MTNTTYISNFEKVAALVEVERCGYFDGPISAAMEAGLDEGYLLSYVSTSPDHPGVVIFLTQAGRERLAGFRTLLGVD